MKLTIVAATGGVGRQLLEGAVAAGHNLTAVARNPDKLTRPVRTVTADLASVDPAVLEAAVASADAVLSALGPHSNADAGIAAPGTRHPAPGPSWPPCRQRVSGASSWSVPRRWAPSPRPATPTRRSTILEMGSSGGISSVAVAMFGKVYDDLAQMEDILWESGLDWTIIRPPQLTDNPPTGTYRTAVDRNVRGGFSVSRADSEVHNRLQMIAPPDMTISPSPWS